MLCLLALISLAVVFVEISKRWVLVFVNLTWEEGILIEELTCGNVYRVFP